MSAKWRALQHRHRYTYSAIVYPQYYKQALDEFINLSASQVHDASGAVFYSLLNEFVSLNSTYTQLNHAKKLAAAFTELLKTGNESVVAQASRFYLEIIFFENSVPLHRTLVSVLAKTRDFQSVIGKSFRSLCEEYADVNANDNWNGKRKRFCVSRVGLSMMSSPKLGYLVEVVEECAVLMGLDVVSGLNSVVSETNDWSRPSPVVMEQCQEALSCIYYLLQRCPSKFSSFNNDNNIMEMILTIILSILKSEAFSRDCFVAAGVSFCAALQVCLCPEELGLAFMEGIFHRSLTLSNTFQAVVTKIPYKGNLFSEIQEVSVLTRLCLIRGILTSVPRTLLNTPFVCGCEESEVLHQTILYDGILPELCNYCENPTDSHFNFHSLTVMQICLQQIKTLIQTSPNKDHDIISDDISGRLLRIIWNNLEDPLSQTVKQVHLIFDIFLDIHSSLPSTNGKERIQLFLKKIVYSLLRMGARCKGRYVPLASLTKRLGAKTVLDMNPNLVFETSWAYVDDDVCSAATTFLKCFLECLRDEFWSSDGVEIGYANYRKICLPPFMHGLASGNSKLRSNLNTYAFPVILEVDVDSIFPMLAFISIGPVEENSTVSSYSDVYGTNINLKVEKKVAVLVSLLKVSRSLALIEGDVDRFENGEYALLCVKSIKVKVLVKWLMLALSHVDESLRTDAIESLFLNPKTASLPSSLELSMMREAMPLNMRCSSTSFQMKLTSLLRKFFNRVRTALERQIKQKNWQPFNKTEDVSFKQADDLFSFMKWLSSFLFFSCYPSAPYERKILAMDLILVMNGTWSIVQDSQDSETMLIAPYDAAFISPEATLLLVSSIVDSWDRLRENSFHILLHFPTPLPGMLTTDMVKEVLVWAKHLVCSPRVRESDAGALTMRLVFRKYVLDLGWVVKPSSNYVGFSKENSTVDSAVVEYMTSLIDWLCDSVEAGEKDLSDACRNSFVHGVLLTLRYTFEELDWNSNIVLDNIIGMKRALEKLLELVTRITVMALSVVAADAWHLPDDVEDLMDDDSYMWEASADVDLDLDVSVSESEKEISSKLVQDVGPSDQVVMVGCWLAMKEVSLLLGTIIRKVPLPTSDMSQECGPLSDSNDNVVLDFKQLETIGNHFLEVLMKMKHNGAIDKTRAGFTALCNRLLCSDNPRLGKLTESWIEQLMERTVARQQTVDDLLRRSAGIPAAFIAFFLSEPEGTPKQLLPRALRWLIDLANKPMTSQIETKTSVSKPETQTNGDSKASSKIRDEGVIPTVHAFNVLRVAFNDTNLATDTSGFAAEAMIVSIRSFSSSYWEVRNSACLAYTALVRRMIGFLNVHKRESARRALSGLEFFHRYPSLHPFLYSELKIATELLTTGSTEHIGSNLANAVHPSLCPMLMLLSRLNPSTIASETGDLLDPFLFMPSIRKCSTQSNLRVRVLASRALTGLISNEKLQVIVLNIATELPSGRNLVSSNMVHGLLLQLIALLDVNCRNLTDSSKKDQILNELVQILIMRSWIGNPRLCLCPTLNTGFLKVLDIMLNISRTCHVSESFDHIYNLLWELSSKCLDLEASRRLPYYDPTLAECRKQAATSYFNCVFQTSKDTDKNDVYTPVLGKQSPSLSNRFTGFQERLIRSMSDASYEVRIATFKWLLLFLKSAEFNDRIDDLEAKGNLVNWVNLHLHTEMENLLSQEKNHRCICLILKLLFTWNQLNVNKSCDLLETRFVGNVDSDSLFLFWDKLVSLYKRTRHVKIREVLLCCMAVCVKQFSVMFTTQSDHVTDLTTKVYDCISYYVDLVKQHADPSEPVNIRKAAAESVIASGLLQTVDFIGQHVTGTTTLSNMYASRTLEMWSTCIKLLEDEDVSLRSKLAGDVQKCSTSETNLVIPSQVDKVIISSFDHLSLIFGHWVNYFDYLANWVLYASNNVGSNGDLVRRVFDKEIDNHHEEKLLLCQICCLHLEKIPVSESLSVDFLLEWRKRFLTRLMSFAVEHNKKVNWIGGLGNHKDAFLPVYSNLLGVYAVSRCVFKQRLVKREEALVREVSDLGDVIKPFLGNPLISNLFLLVVRLHEGSVASGDVAVWDGFDPYFLLR